MSDETKKFKAVLSIVMVKLLVLLVLSYFIMLLWNMVIPNIFGIREIVYSDALILKVLVNLFTPEKTDK